MQVRLAAVAILVPTLAVASVAARGAQKGRSQDVVLGRDVEIRLPGNTRALAESLASVARESGVLIGFETVLDTDEGHTKSEFAWAPRGQRVGEVLDSLLAIHPDYQWREMNGVIHVRPRSAVADPNHFLNHAVGPLELKDALPLHATFEIHRVFIPRCVVKHPIYTDEREEFLKEEHEAMRRPLTLSFPGGTVLDLLDAVVKAHGALYWNVTYRVPPERLHRAAPRYEYAVFGFSGYPQTGGWWRMCVGIHDDMR